MFILKEICAKIGHNCAIGRTEEWVVVRSESVNQSIAKFNRNSAHIRSEWGSVMRYVINLSIDLLYNREYSKRAIAIKPMKYKFRVTIIQSSKY